METYYENRNGKIFNILAEDFERYHLFCHVTEGKKKLILQNLTPKEIIAEIVAYNLIYRDRKNGAVYEFITGTPYRTIRNYKKALSKIFIVTHKKGKIYLNFKEKH